MSKKVLRLVLVALVAVMGVASVAWACITGVGMAGIQLNPNRARVGVPVQSTVNGEGWRPGVVDLRWYNHAQQEIADLPDATVPTAHTNFSVQVSIPQSAVGHYYVMAVQRQDAQIVQRAAAFEWQPAFSNGAQTTDPGGDQGTQTDQGTNTESDGSKDSNRNPATAAIPPGPGNDSSSGGNSPDPAGPPAAQTAPASGRVPGQSTAPAASLSNVPASAGVAMPGAEASSAAAAAASAEQQRRGKLATVASDLWRGFDKGSSGLTPSLTNLAEPRTVSPQTALLALAGLGGMALAGGFAVAEGRRRRQLAQGGAQDL